MKKKIGITAAIVGLTDLFVWILLLVSGNIFENRGLTGFVFVLWFVCVIITVICLAGDFVKFLGRSFADGCREATPNTGAFCPHCGKAISPGVAFCPHCGQKGTNT